MKREHTPGSDISSLNKFQKYFYDYGRYHDNFINVLIHIVFIPIITLSTDKLVGYFATEYYKFPFNPFYIVYAIVMPIYLYVDYFSGIITSAQYLGLSYLLRDARFDCCGFTHIQVLLIVYCSSWISQFIGHGLFEGRKPALMDNIFLTTNAPVFANIEIMYYLFGYRQEEIDETKKYIHEDIKEYKASKVKAD
jgi:uncharacterized membrane protein YGL010W